MYVPYIAMTARKKTFTLPPSHAHCRKERCGQRSAKRTIRRKKASRPRAWWGAQVCVLDARGVAVSELGGVRVRPRALLRDGDLVRRPRVLWEGELDDSLLVGGLQVVVDHAAAHEADGGSRHGLRRSNARAGGVCERVCLGAARGAARGMRAARGAWAARGMRRAGMPIR